MPFILDARAFEESDALLLKNFVQLTVPAPVKVEQSKVQLCQERHLPKSRKIKDAVHGDVVLFETSCFAPSPVATAPRLVACRSFCLKTDEIVVLTEIEEAVTQAPSKRATQTRVTEECSVPKVNPIKEVVHGHRAVSMTESAPVTLPEKSTIGARDKVHFKQVIHPVPEGRQAVSVQAPAAAMQPAKVSWKDQARHAIDTF